MHILSVVTEYRISEKKAIHTKVFVKTNASTASKARQCGGLT